MRSVTPIKPLNGPTPKKSQIGRCGELLVQYQLLLRGVESSPMTTDSGIDLVAYPPALGHAVTIQVKTNLRPKRAGGKGDELLSWSLSKANPAELVALVHLATADVWMLTHEEFEREAQQTQRPAMVLYRYLKVGKRQGRPRAMLDDFSSYRLERQFGHLFGS